MRISIEGFSVHGLLREGMIDDFGFLESLAFRYRVDGAGLWNGLLASTEPGYIAKVRQALEERELALPCIHFDACSVWADDPAQRAAQREQALRNIEVAHELGASSVRIDWGVTAATLSNEQFDHIVATFRDYCERAGEHGMRLGPENHFGASLDPELQLEVLAAVQCENYGVLLHLGHWDRMFEDGDRMLAPHAMHTHISAEMLAAHYEHSCRSIQQLKDAGYTGYWGVEHHTARHEYAQLAWQLGELRRVLAFGAEGEIPINRGKVRNRLLVEYQE
jgi:sugar phosphate isomerase/epimerase